jgi:hypothetical protein
MHEADPRNHILKMKAYRRLGIPSGLARVLVRLLLHFLEQAQDEHYYQHR